MAIGSNVDRAKYEVIIIDGRLEDDPIARIEKHLPDAICFGATVLTGSPLKDALEISNLVSKLAPSLPIIWGGWHASLFPTEVLKDTPSVDFTVQGQGEITFSELLECIESSGDFAKIDGICYRTADGTIKKNKGRVLTPMDQLVPVDYSLIDVEAYFRLKKRRQLDYISSTGCYFRCTFCADPFVFNRSFTAISAERVGEELAELHEKYRFDDLNFQDETFFTYPKRIEAIADELIARSVNISWAATMRADQGFRMTDEQFSKCVTSGMRRVLIGVESGSQEMMDWLAKDIKMEHVLFSAERCKQFGVSVIFPFIVGFPGESDKSIHATKKLIKHLRKMSRSFDTPVFYFKPYPGSKITEDVVKEGYQLPSTTAEWADFDYIGSKGPWVSEQKYREFERFKFYTKAAYSKQGISKIPIQLLAKARCSLDFYALAFEKRLFDYFVPKQRLS